MQLFVSAHTKHDIFTNENEFNGIRHIVHCTQAVVVVVFLNDCRLKIGGDVRTYTDDEFKSDNFLNERNEFFELSNELRLT